MIIIIEIKEWNLNLNNWTTLHYAANYDSIQIAELLISKGANINEKDIIYLNIFSLN